MNRLGHDIQNVPEFAAARSLHAPGLIFTNEECQYCTAAATPASSFAGFFAAKEALFKALPQRPSTYWTDMEVWHDTHNAPSFRLHGLLGQWVKEQGWQVQLSISHSGEYASAVVLVAPGGSL